MDKKELRKMGALNREAKALRMRECAVVDILSRRDALRFGEEDVRKYEEELEIIRTKIKYATRRCMEEFKKISSYIDAIDDGEIRTLLSLRYVNGLSWQQIAFHVGGGNTQDAVRKRVSRFFAAK